MSRLFEHNADPESHVPGRPVVVLSDNGIDHALLMLAAMHVGRPVCTVSSAYCRLTKDYTKIQGILNTLGPALVYASDQSVYGAAIASAALGVVTVFSRGADDHPGALSFESLTRTAESPAVMAAFEAIQPDDHAKRVAPRMRPHPPSKAAVGLIDLSELPVLPYALESLVPEQLLD